MVVMAPSDAQECEKMLDFGFEYKGPVAVRYPRAKAPEGKGKKSDKIILGKARIIRKGNRVAILSFGALLDRCLEVAENADATLVDMRFIKPLDEEILKKLAKTHTHFVTIEDNAVVGGAGSAVNDCVVRNNLGVRVQNLGLPDRFLPHGTRDEILAEAGLSEENILKKIKEWA
jgi:1-deoxy-D-xylulose-5-phosphate synthase